jgi:hypothetical protein
VLLRLDLDSFRDTLGYYQIRDQNNALGDAIDVEEFLQRHCIKEKEVLSLLLLEPEVIRNWTPEQRMVMCHIYPIATQLAETFVASFQHLENGVPSSAK